MRIETFRSPDRLGKRAADGADLSGNFRQASAPREIALSHRLIATDRDRSGINNVSSHLSYSRRRDVESPSRPSRLAVQRRRILHGRSITGINNYFEWIPKFGRLPAILTV